ncbi:hypothetical protein UR09_02605 [Candidatus Nitromaritima sp. SCGC AAA799-A02]|nr:hypothetical protein UR09_02605 [Candidatus Nitromaritima sp. SCGC AAA799-A02]KMP11870.1 hypothetical protein UZ36_02830 [Candidatus Nitromaritima sp. SCGC AAA799-C22]
MLFIETLISLGAIRTGELETIPCSGAYALVLRVARRVNCKPKKPWELEPGIYIYAGRASRGLPARLARHRKIKKTVRWHIDHLTVHRSVTVEDIFILPGRPELECAIVRELLKSHGTSAPLSRFGSSDCKAACPAHLIRSD